MNLRDRIREAIVALIDREEVPIAAGSKPMPLADIEADAADRLTAAVMGQIADAIGEATQGFQDPRLMSYRSDLRRHPVLGSHLYRVAALRAQALGDEPVPPRRFYVAHTEKRDPTTDEPILSVTFCRFELEEIPKSHAGIVAWDMLDPSWPEVQKVLQTLQAALVNRS